jgi:hypothetical protein
MESASSETEVTQILRGEVLVLNSTRGHRGSVTSFAGIRRKARIYLIYLRVFVALKPDSRYVSASGYWGLDRLESGFRL